MSRAEEPEVVEHDSRRCPECGSRGTIESFNTRTNARDNWRRVKARTFDCDNCDTKWRKYGR